MFITSFGRGWLWFDGIHLFALRHWHLEYIPSIETLALDISAQETFLLESFALSKRVLRPDKCITWHAVYK